MDKGNGNLPIDDLEEKELDTGSVTGAEPEKLDESHEEVKPEGLPIDGEEKKVITNSHLEELKELAGLSHLTDEEYVEHIKTRKAKKTETKKEETPNQDVEKLQKKVERMEQEGKEKEFYNNCKNVFGFNEDEMQEFKQVTQSMGKGSENNATFNVIASGIKSRRSSNKQPDIQPPSGDPKIKDDKVDKTKITDSIYGPDGIFGKKIRN